MTFEIDIEKSLVILMIDDLYQSFYSQSLVNKFIILMSINRPKPQNKSSGIKNYSITL